MTDSMIYKLIQKDLKINQTPILLWSLPAVAGILTANLIPGLVAANIGFCLLASAIIGAGIHMVTHTVLFDHLKGTHIFIMSLPVTFKQYTLSKLLVNIGVFYVMWALLSAVCIYVTFSQGILPMGSLPMMCMVLLSVLPLYSLILSVCIITQSIGYTVVTAVTSSFATPAYLWAVVYWDSVGTYVWGNQAVWNITVYSIMIAQVLIAIIIPVLTVMIQFRKKDFI
ncbi:hypothetical protein [Rhodohalobacter sp. 614A]|uniref:hypothetical protein n=1 Tax=Rhodohalobacter sp. 614A TaxID=2908649 RepID=UPI001F472E73|nr:hypothetical protein [Rhodohalobacter sp. 614A]